LAALSFDDDPVVDLQRALHGNRGDQEHLSDETTQQRGNNHRADNDSRQFFDKGQRMLAESQLCWIRSTSLELFRL